MFLGRDMEDYNILDQGSLRQEAWIPLPFTSVLPGNKCRLSVMKTVGSWQNLGKVPVIVQSETPDADLLNERMLSTKNDY